MPNALAGDAFIMGTSDAAALFGISMDQETSGALVLPDGRVCFGILGGDPVDCVAYGNFSGDNSGGGFPAVPPQRGMALVRHGDTGDDLSDFAIGDPIPRNNAGQVGIRGRCSGDGGTPTQSPRPTATAAAPPAGRCVGDCDGSGDVEIAELILGVNITLNRAELSACPSLDANGNGVVEINELVTAVNNALKGCPKVPTPIPTSSACTGLLCGVWRPRRTVPWVGDCEERRCTTFGVDCSCEISIPDVGERVSLYPFPDHYVCHNDQRLTAPFVIGRTADGVVDERGRSGILDDQIRYEEHDPRGIPADILLEVTVVDVGAVDQAGMQTVTLSGSTHVTVDGGFFDSGSCPLFHLHCDAFTALNVEVTRCVAPRCIDRTPEFFCQE